MTLALFDLDNTLVRGNMSVRFGLFLFRRHLFPRWKLLLTMGIYSLFSTGFLSFKNMQQRIFQILFKGKRAETMTKAAFEFCESVFDVHFRCSVISELERFQQEGATVAILSSSPDFIVKLFAERLGVHHFFASSYLVNSEGKFEKVVPYLGSDKKESLKYFSGHTKTVAFSDSFADISLLQEVDVPVAVSPDKALLKYAQKHKWTIV